MPITLSCSCGKVFTLKDELAGRRIRCPACQGVMEVPAPEEEMVEPVVTEEPDAGEEELPAQKPKKKKKKKKKMTEKDLTPLSKRQKREQEIERQDEKRRAIIRVIRSSAFLGLGLVALIGSVWGLISYGSMVFDAPMSMIGLGAGLVVGLAAIGKGLLGLVFGQETD
jgi:hypothetical protein